MQNASHSQSKIFFYSNANFRLAVYYCHGCYSTTSVVNFFASMHKNIYQMYTACLLFIYRVLYEYIRHRM